MIKKLWNYLSGKSNIIVSNERVALILMAGLGLYHCFLLALYLIYDMTLLSVLNLISVLVYAGCVIAVRRKKEILLVHNVGYAEIVIQVLVAGMLLDSHCGFQFYLVALVCHAFYIGYIYRDSDRVNVMHYVIIAMSAFILLQVGARFVEPVYEFRDPWMAKVLYVINFFSAITAMLLSMSTLLTQIVHLEGRLLQKNKDLEILSHTDALTGLANRRGIEEKYQYVMEHSKQYAMIMADIDDFKVINDTYGHNVGDLVLQQVAEVFQGCVRGDDMVCRWGGEEILVFLPLCKREGANLTAERILDRIRKAQIEMPDGGTIGFSMTLGVAVSDEGEDLQSVIERADARLYEGKQNGKNRVVCA